MKLFNRKQRLIESLDLQPGDILVLHSDYDNPQQVRHLQNHLRDFLGQVGVQDVGLFVLPKNTRLTHLRGEAVVPQ